LANISGLEERAKNGKIENALSLKGIKIKPVRADRHHIKR
jgi:hypothetical protein